MNGFEFPLWVWTVFFVTVLVALFVDIGIVNRKAHVPSRRETFTWAIVWVSLALGFNVFVYYVVSDIAGAEVGAFKAKEFFTGYLIELSLSIDNLFVFLLIFSYFAVPKEFQHRVLFWGIMGALIMRMVMIFAGAELVERFHWILYVFGAFLIYTGIKMFSDDEEGFNPEESRLVALVTRYIRIKKEYVGSKFVIIEDGKRVGTLLLLVLIVVELSDVIFAVDSIPAIFGITTDRFIVYTSNIFAILGLRTFFFLLADMADRFHFLKYGLAFVLTFIGVKMLLPLAAETSIQFIGDGSHSGFAALVHNYLEGAYKQEIINISLSVVTGTIFLSIILSLIFPVRHDKKGADAGSRPAEETE
ncbi:MAG: TerC family protein [Acidobacteria bacterium]|nr:MAG: TerC family protein [Acidobacteriota bacterium]REK02896.1 MAG: TerC family protein [Acidobacteriota bacterium]REK13300.1 MAG: TerC family protein [Acidobacteriota bacterium]REK41294.1 MAG: TerC family protein [Acidobacteriota bacterium]